MATKTKKKPARKKLPEALKLNLGAGDYPLDGYENLDRKTGQEVYPLDYPDECADEIRASHVLEHFSYTQTLDVVGEWVRVLKPGGILKVSVPDFQLICNMVAEGHPIHAEGYIMGGHIDDDDHHGAIFDACKLAEVFYRAGLVDARRWKSDTDDTSGSPISLNLMAQKPSAGKMEFHGVHFIAPTPRFGPSEHHRCIYDALRVLQAKVHTVGGCFWNQHLCNAMEAEIADPECRYVCTLDYDSVFSTNDVAEMYRIMETHPHIDALVPMQSHRGADTPLFTIQNKYGENVQHIDRAAFDGLTCPITTGHFGLTFIRAEKLREFPRPWMVPRLAPDHTWGEGHIDADIDFWLKWKDHGNVVHLANRVVIGHMQEAILWPGDDLSPVWQKVSDYVKHGKPPEAR